MEYPLDIQVDYSGANDMPKDASGNPILHNTAEVRLVGRDQTNTANASRLWTGLELARMTGDPTAPFSEKWFIGMDSTTDHLIVRANGNQNILDIDPSKGAVCTGAILQGITNISDPNAYYIPSQNGYKAVNTLCDSKFSGSHVCSTQEIFRTAICNVGRMTSDALSP